jgi:hypothetical protein
MKAGRLLFVCGLFVVAGLTSADTQSREQKKLADVFSPSVDLRVTPNDAFAANYPDTECVDFSLANNGEKIGFICRSKSKAFIAEMGITRIEALAEGVRPKIRPTSGLIVSTPMTQYAMRPFKTGHGDANSADVDCDTENESNYRPTSTCHVAVSSLDGQEVIYSNFVLIRHITKKRGASKAQIKKLW